MPMKARRTRPCRTSSPSTYCAVFAAMAKQIPCAPRMIAVLIPTTSPREAAGIPRIERGVGLDQVVDQPAVACAQRAAERRDHSRGYGRFESERIADRDHQLAAAQLLGI